VLGVDATASPATIDNRYRELAKSLHPDRNADPADQERFKQVSAAYSALKDPSTRYAYDEFRSRVAEGRLYVAAPAPAPRPAPGRVEHLAPPRTPRTRPPMPPWLRATLAALMMVLGVFGLGWALFGELPSPAHADTPVAVQVTLVIMALKFLACGVALGALLVELGCRGRGATARRRRTHRDRPSQLVFRDRDHVAERDRFAGLRSLLIELHAAVGDGRGGLCPRLEEARGPEPLVQSDLAGAGRIHAGQVSRL